MTERFLVTVDHARERRLEQLDALNDVGLNRGVARAHAFRDRAEIIGSNRHEQFLLVVEMACERSDGQTSLVAHAVKREPARALARNHAPCRCDRHTSRVCDIHQPRRTRFIWPLVNSRRLRHSRPSRFEAPFRPGKGGDWPLRCKSGGLIFD